MQVKKKTIFIVTAFILIAAVSTYFFDEYRTKNLVQYLFNTEDLGGEIRDISILQVGDKEVKMETIDKNNLLFSDLVQSIENLEIKKGSFSDISNSEVYTLSFIHGNASHHISFHKNGALRFDGEIYKVQSEDSIEELFELLKKGIN